MWGGTTPTMLLAWFTATPSHGWCVSLPAAVGLAVAVGVATKLIFCPCMPAGVPPGSLGLPLIGESLNVLFNFPAWLADRSARHGPVFVSHILFHPVVVVAPTPANVAWFVRTERRGQLQRSLPRALRTIFGRRGLLSQVNGPDRDRVRAAVEDHLRGHNVMGMVRPLAAIVRRRVRRWRRERGTGGRPRCQARRPALPRARFLLSSGRHPRRMVWRQRRWPLLGLMETRLRGMGPVPRPPTASMG